VGAALVLCGLWALTLAAPDQPLRGGAAPQPAPAARAETALPSPAGLPTAAPAVAVAVAAAPATEPPPGVSRAQWAQIEAEAAQRADAPAELQRLRAYLEWSDALRRFRDARAAGARAAELAALARSLDEGLAERIRQAELSAGEARQIKNAVLEVTVADEALRAEQLRRWAAAELAPAVPADPRQAAFERRQVEVVAAWSALPPAARDPAALERELEALRQQSFSTAGTR